MTLKDQMKNAEVVDWLGAGLSEMEMKQTKELAKISAKIEMKRRELDLSQKEFAEKMGVSQGMISKWESGTYNFSINTLHEICEKLGLSFEPVIRDAYKTEEQFKVIDGGFTRIERLEWRDLGQIEDADQLGVGA